MIGGLLKSVSGAALFAAVGIFAVGGVPAAKAADLGGDCCADLEERVAELEATTARKGNRRVSLTISGQVTTHVMYWNDGNDSDVYVVDNTAGAGGSGFQLNGSAKINPNLTAGFDLALGVSAGSRSNQVSQGEDDGVGASRVTGDTNIAVLRANWYLDHKTLGRLTVGRINTASAGATAVDLGGAGVIANVNLSYWNGSFESGVGTWGALLGANVGGSALSRANAVMYSTPTFAGFSASVAWGEDDAWDAALRYAGEFSGFRVAAAIAYTENNTGFGDFSDGAPPIVQSGFVGLEPTSVKGSASILHVATGLFLTGAYVNQDYNEAGTPDTTLWYVQGGVSKNWTGLGNTVLYGEYGNVEDGLAGAVSSEANVWGLGIVQHVDAAAMELYLSYRRYSGEATFAVEQKEGPPATRTLDANDFDVVVGGARIRF
jgi:hypothetical protein